MGRGEEGGEEEGEEGVMEREWEEGGEEGVGGPADEGEVDKVGGRVEKCQEKKKHR